MFLLFYQHQQVTVNPAIGSGIALASHRQLHAFGHTCRNVDGHHFLALDNAIAAAVRAFVLDDLACTAASAANRHLLHHTKHSTLLRHHLATTLTSRTSGHTTFVLGTGATAMLTRNQLLDLDFLFNTSIDLLQGQFHLDTDIGTTAHTFALAAATATKTREAGKTASRKTGETTSEQITETFKDGIQVKINIIASASSPAHARMTELIVTGFLVRIAQHIVGLGRLLELFLRLLVARITVGMVLHGFLSVGLFYLFSRRGFLHAQHFIIVSFFHTFNQFSNSLRYFISLSTNVLVFIL